MSQTFDTVDAQVLYNILTNLCTKPESIAIERLVDQMGVLLSVWVDAEDMGVVIGRSGIMASAIKTVLKAVGKTHSMNVRVKFEEPKNGTRKPREEMDHSDRPAFESHKQDTTSKAPAADMDHELDEFVIN
jgi:uncharacterized protein